MTDAHSTAPVEYRDVPNWPRYRVSDRGAVETSHRYGNQWRTLSVSLDRAGRPTVHLSCGKLKRTKRVCALVLTAFVGPCPAGLECRHLNGDPADNRLENLAWGTHTENMADRNRHGNYVRGSRHFNAKLTEDDVRLMRRLKREGWSLSMLMRRFGIAKTTVAQIVNGLFWKHVTEEG